MTAKDKLTNKNIELSLCFCTNTLVSLSLLSAAASHVVLLLLCFANPNNWTISGRMGLASSAELTCFLDLAASGFLRA